MSNSIRLHDMPQCPDGTYVNVTALFRLGIPHINLRALAALADIGLNHNAPKFVAGILRFRIPIAHYVNDEQAYDQDVAALVNNNGKVVLTGASNEENANAAAWALVLYLRKHNMPARMLNFKIQNIVVTFHAGFKINLKRFLQVGAGKVEQTTCFPAAIYTIGEKKIKYPDHCVVLGMFCRCVCVDCRLHMEFSSL
jgi:hypothetical protein